MKVRVPGAHVQTCARPHRSAMQCTIFYPDLGHMVLGMLNGHSNRNPGGRDRLTSG